MGFATISVGKGGGGSILFVLSAGGERITSLSLEDSEIEWKKDSLSAFLSLD